MKSPRPNSAHRRATITTRLSCCLGLGLAMGLSGAVNMALAADLIIAPKVDAVTIYPNGATLTRRERIDLPAGLTSLVIENVSRTADLTSLRPGGDFDAPVRVQSINVSRQQNTPLTSDEIETLEAELRALTNRLGVLTDRRFSAESQLRMAEAFSKEAPKGFTEALAQRDNALADWAQAMAAIRDTTQTARAEIRDVTQQEQMLEAEIEIKQMAIEDLRARLSPLTLTIDVMADSASSGTFELSYQTIQATWSPSYDAFLNSKEDGTAELRLVQLANIAQNTGENWTDVAISLSTTRPAQGISVPAISPLQVQLRELLPSPVGAEPSARLSERLALPQESGGLALQTRSQSGEIALQDQFATADNTAYQAKFVLAGRLDVAGNGEGRHVTMAEHRVEADLFAVAVPSLQEVAFLHAQLTNETGGPLLGGLMSVYRDDAYMGQTQFGFMGVNEVRSLGFGADDRIDISYVIEERQVAERGLISAEKTDTRRYVTKITNNHERPIRIRVLDRQPFSEDETIVVERLATSTAPSDENVNDQRGIMAWSYIYAPGESRDIQLDYRISWPGEADLTFRNQP